MYPNLSLSKKCKKWGGRRGNKGIRVVGKKEREKNGELIIRQATADNIDVTEKRGFARTATQQRIRGEGGGSLKDRKQRRRTGWDNPIGAANS